MHNYLLDALPRELYREIEPRLERLTLRRGSVLHEPGSVIRHLHFPLTCLVSITISTRDGKTAETGVAGNREMVGVNAFMGGSETTQTRYVVQIPGEVLRIPSQPLLDAFDANKGVRDVLLKYTQAMIAQISQNAACNRLHDVRNRYARWLLEVSDRVHSAELRLTHEFAAEMLAVRRATVTDMAAHFADEGVVEVNRGMLHILDSAALERASCECYRVLRTEYDRLLGIDGDRHSTPAYGRPSRSAAH
jgi:CRP-like cAMP-binding protein